MTIKKSKRYLTPAQADLMLRMERFMDNPTNLTHLHHLLAEMVNYELSARLAAVAKEDASRDLPSLALPPQKITSESIVRTH
ncbi:hypothetical protein [Duganella qianjiadongensis]|uniref:Transposase n=1 Tax=Duganella qianjiadongensis TaxID=2692176 RepID=A0ABW9VIS6_9BURK|nr:hypothetical protein [Duganella qianjiadongensis]MYM38647.1 hypothetical protein [Duganella qianjiadongensis]